MSPRVSPLPAARGDSKLQGLNSNIRLIDDRGYGHNSTAAMPRRTSSAAESPSGVHGKVMGTGSGTIPELLGSRSERDLGARLLRCGDGGASDAPRVRDPDRDPSGDDPRGDRNPDSAWVTHQVPQPGPWGERLGRHPVRDPRQGHEVLRSFDEVLRTEGEESSRRQSDPPADAQAERWVRFARVECPDRVLVFGRRLLERVLGTAGPLRQRQAPPSLELKTPEPRPDPEPWPARRRPHPEARRPGRAHP